MNGQRIYQKALLNWVSQCLFFLNIFQQILPDEGGWGYTLIRDLLALKMLHGVGWGSIG